MKAVLENIVVFLVINAVAPAPMYYIYEEHPDAGYDAAVSDTGSFKYRMNNHKKYFIGSNNQKYMKLVNERAVDSHFTVLKTPPKPFVSKENKYANEISEVKKNSQNYGRKIKDAKPNNNEHHVSASTKNDIEITLQDKHITPIPANKPNNAIQHGYKQNREQQRIGENISDKKRNFVSVNARKAAVSKEDKVVMKNSNQPFMHPAQIYHYRVTGAAVKEKGLHKSPVTNERKPQVVSTKKQDLERHIHMAFQNNDGFIQKTDQNSRRLDSKKRDTIHIEPTTPNINSKPISVSDKIRKYIHKDMNNYKENRNSVVSSRIGNHEEIVDNHETPYALFYRTNSEHLDEQEVLVENPLAQPSNAAFDDKSAWNLENETQEDPVHIKTKRAPNIKIHKKVMNHTSYRT